MEGMRPPQLPAQPVEVIGPEHLARLLKACEGQDFTSRRNTANILLSIDTGMRRAECAGTTLDDVAPGPAHRVGAGARADDPGRCRSATRPPRHSTATYVSEKSTGWPSGRRVGVAEACPEWSKSACGSGGWKPLREAALQPMPDGAGSSVAGVTVRPDDLTPSAPHPAARTPTHRRHAERRTAVALPVWVAGLPVPVSEGGCPQDQPGRPPARPPGCGETPAVHRHLGSPG